MIASTPPPPYYAVIFTSVKQYTGNEYNETAKRMIELAQKQEGFLGVESAGHEEGITVSYWKDLESIRAWKRHTEHMLVQQKGRQEFYTSYKTRICLVERDYIFEKK